jgi:hypothetical protein
MNRIFQDVVGIVIGLTIFKTSFETAPRHPHGEATAMVVASVVIFGEFSL